MKAQILSSETVNLPDLGRSTPGATATPAPENKNFAAVLADITSAENSHPPKASVEIKQKHLAEKNKTDDSESQSPKTAGTPEAGDVAAVPSRTAKRPQTNKSAENDAEPVPAALFAFTGLLTGARISQVDKPAREIIAATGQEKSVAKAVKNSVASSAITKNIPHKINANLSEATEAVGIANFAKSSNTMAENAESLPAGVIKQTVKKTAAQTHGAVTPEGRKAPGPQSEFKSARNIAANAEKSTSAHAAIAQNSPTPAQDRAMNPLFAQEIKNTPKLGGKSQPVTDPAVNRPANAQRVPERANTERNAKAATVEASRQSEPNSPAPAGSKGSEQHLSDLARMIATDANITKKNGGEGVRPAKTTRPDGASRRPATEIAATEVSHDFTQTTPGRKTETSSRRISRRDSHIEKAARAEQRSAEHGAIESARRNEQTRIESAAVQARQIAATQPETENYSTGPETREAEGLENRESAPLISERHNSQSGANNGGGKQDSQGYPTPAHTQEGIPTENVAKPAQTDAFAKGQDAQELRRQFDRLVQKAKMVLGPGQSGTLTIALQPKTLGFLNLQVRWQGNTMKARLLAETPEAAQALRAHWGHLQQSLADAGYQLEAAEISQANEADFPNAGMSKRADGSVRTAPAENRGAATTEATIDVVA